MQMMISNSLINLKKILIKKYIMTLKPINKKMMRMTTMMRKENISIRNLSTRSISTNISIRSTKRIEKVSNFE